MERLQGEKRKRRETMKVRGGLEEGGGAEKKDEGKGTAEGGE